MGLEIKSPPRISRQGFVRLLEAARSPAAPVAGMCYDVIAGYGLDPAIGLAMFQHESTYGTKGAAVSTHNWGNVRPPASGWLQAHGLNDGQNSSWLLFRQRTNEPAGGEWLRSCELWAILVDELYVSRWGLLTVEQAIQKYAPSADGNKPNAYAAAVVGLVAFWAEEYPPVAAEPAPDLLALLQVLLTALEVRVAAIEFAPPCWGPPVEAVEFAPATTTGAAKLDDEIPY